MASETIERMDRAQLLQMIDMYSKNWLAMDGVWFQSIERKLGMDEAMEHDENAWRAFTVIEAKRIKSFLGLSEKPGIQGLKQALALRMYANINKDEIIIQGNVLLYRTLSCRVQEARKRKGLPYHPCKSVGIVEYGLFASTIDQRFALEPISCYPDVTDSTCSCSWKFTLAEESPPA